MKFPDIRESTMSGNFLAKSDGVKTSFSLKMLLKNNFDWQIQDSLQQQIPAHHPAIIFFATLIFNFNKYLCTLIPAYLSNILFKLASLILQYSAISLTVGWQSRFVFKKINRITKRDRIRNRRNRG